MKKEEKEAIAQAFVVKAKKVNPEKGYMRVWYDSRRQCVGNCVRNGTMVIWHEYYRDEAMDDDDLSTGGWQLPAIPGLTRVSTQWPEDDFGSINDSTIQLMQLSI